MMFSVPLEDLSSLSKREKAYCIRAELFNAAQILHATHPGQSTDRHPFDATEAENIRERVAYAQAPKPVLVLDYLDNIDAGPSNAKKYEGSPGGISSMETSASGRKRKSAAAAGSTSYPLSNRLALTTGDEEMDKLLGGGVRRGCLTEVVGESACGKTQLVLQTALFAALGLKCLEVEDEGIESSSIEGDYDLYKALGGCGIRPRSATSSVVILSSGGTTTSRQMIRRTEQMMRLLVEERWVRTRGSALQEESIKRPRKEGQRARSSGRFLEEGYVHTLQDAQELAKTQLWDNVHIYNPRDYESLEHIISYQLPALAANLRSDRTLKRPPLGLIIIDDLPSLFIEDYDTKTNNQRTWTMKRSRMLCEISDRLKRLAVSCCGSQSSKPPTPSAAIIVVNQVVDTFSRRREVLRSVLNNRSSLSQLLNSTAPPILSSTTQDGFYNGVLASLDPFIIKEARNQIHAGREEDEIIDWMSKSTKAAALGYMWVHCINVRIMLAHTDRHAYVKSEQDGNGGGKVKRFPIRRAVGVLNPFARAGEGGEPCVEYLVQGKGLMALSSCNLADVLDDEDHLWSLFEENFSTADLMAFEEQARIEADDADEAGSSNIEHTTTFDEEDDEELWQNSGYWEETETDNNDEDLPPLPFRKL